MILELHNNLTSPKRIKCTRAVVRDDFNNVVAVVFEHAPGLITLSGCNDSGFSELLKVLGIADTTIVCPLEDASKSPLVLPKT